MAQQPLKPSSEGFFIYFYLVTLFSTRGRVMGDKSIASWAMIETKVLIADQISKIFFKNQKYFFPQTGLQRLPESLIKLISFQTISLFYKLQKSIDYSHWQ